MWAPWWLGSQAGRFCTQTLTSCLSSVGLKMQFQSCETGIILRASHPSTTLHFFPVEKPFSDLYPGMKVVADMEARERGHTTAAPIL